MWKHVYDVVVLGGGLAALEAASSAAAGGARVLLLCPNLDDLAARPGVLLVRDREQLDRFCFGAGLGTLASSAAARSLVGWDADCFRLAFDPFSFREHLREAAVGCDNLFLRQGTPGAVVRKRDGWCVVSAAGMRFRTAVVIVAPRPCAAWLERLDIEGWSWRDEAEPFRVATPLLVRFDAGSEPHVAAPPLSSAVWAEGWPHSVLEDGRHGVLFCASIGYGIAVLDPAEMRGGRFLPRRILHVVGGGRECDALRLEGDAPGRSFVRRRDGLLICGSLLGWTDPWLAAASGRLAGLVARSTTPADEACAGAADAVAAPCCGDPRRAFQAGADVLSLVEERSLDPCRQR